MFCSRQWLQRMNALALLGGPWSWLLGLVFNAMVKHECFCKVSSEIDLHSLRLAVDFSHCKANVYLRNGKEELLTTSSPGMHFGQNFLFFMRAKANTPFSSSAVIASNAQKLPSSVMVRQEPHIPFVNCNSRPTVLPSDSNSFAGRSGGLSFPSMSSTAHIIPVKPQQMVWYSLPKGQGFLGTNI